MSRAKSLPRSLPYWVTRTIDTPNGPVSCFIMKDGTLVAGFEVAGIDTYTEPPHVARTISQALMDAIDLLPANGFLQATVESGHSFRPLVREYFAECTPKDPIMREARRQRALMLADDPTVTRTRIHYYVGLRDALGPLLAHGSAPRRWFPQFSRKTHPTEIRSATVLRAAIELRTLLDRITATLTGVGFGLSEIDEAELVKLAYDRINPRASSVFPPPFIVRSRQDLERAALGQPLLFAGPNLSSQLSLATIKNGARHLRIDEPERLVRMMGIQRYPTASTPGWFDPVLIRHLPDTPLRLSVTHSATNQTMSVSQLETKRNFLKTLALQRKTNHRAVAAYQDYEELLKAIETGATRILDTSIVVELSADTLLELDDATLKVESGFAASRAVASTQEDKQLTLWLSSLPAAGYRAFRPYPVVSRNAAHLTPFFQPDTGVGHADMVFSTRQRTLRKLEIRKGGTRDDANFAIVGGTGSGKTFWFSHFAKTTLALGGHVVIADIKGPHNSTYKPICESLGGQYIPLHALDADVSFNPCPPHSVAYDIATGEWTDALDALRDIICMMTVPNFDVDPNRDFFRHIATAACVDTYKRTASSKETPILSYVLESLRSYSSDEPRLTSIAADMALRLSTWCSDRKRSALLNRPSNLADDNPLQVFDFYGMKSDSELANILISTLSARLYTKMQTLPLTVPKLFHFDEAWEFFEHSQLTSELVGTLFRVARSYGAIVGVASQSDKDITDSAPAVAMMANISLYFLLRAAGDHARAGEAFGMNDLQVELYEKLEKVDGQYAEFLYLDKHIQKAAVLRYSPTPYELWIDTSKDSDQEMRKIYFQRFAERVDAYRELASKYPYGATKQDVAAERARQTADKPDTETL